MLTRIEAVARQFNGVKNDFTTAQDGHLKGVLAITPPENLSQERALEYGKELINLLLQENHQKGKENFVLFDENWQAHNSIILNPTKSNNAVKILPDNDDYNASPTPTLNISDVGSDSDADVSSDSDPEIQRKRKELQTAKQRNEIKN